MVDVHNPLDLTPIANAAITAAVARTILEADEVDVGIVGLVPMTDTLETLPAGPGHGEDLARPDAIAAVLAAVAGDDQALGVRGRRGPLYAPCRRLRAAGIPVLATADAATRVLAAWCDATVGRG